MPPLLLTLTLALASAASPVRENPYLAEARSRYASLEYTAALESLKVALAYPGTATAELAEIHLFRGLCQLQLGKEGQGREALRAALRADPEVRLPPMTSPKIHALFEEERAALPRPPPAPREVPAAAAPVAPAPETSPVVERAPVRWPAYAAWGCAAAALAVGAVLGVQAQDLASQSRRAEYASEHVRLNDEAQGRARMANGFYVGAAGLTAVGGVLFFTF